MSNPVQFPKPEYRSFLPLKGPRYIHALRNLAQRIWTVVASLFRLFRGECAHQPQQKAVPYNRTAPQNPTAATENDVAPSDGANRELPEPITLKKGTSCIKSKNEGSARALLAIQTGRRILTEGKEIDSATLDSFLKGEISKKYLFLNSCLTFMISESFKKELEFERPVAKYNNNLEKGLDTMDTWAKESGYAAGVLRTDLNIYAILAQNKNKGDEKKFFLINIIGTASTESPKLYIFSSKESLNNHFHLLKEYKFLPIKFL